MSVSCNPSDLAEPIACLGKQDQQTLLAEILYQLCVLNGMACDPDTLAEIDEVKCLSNWDQQSLLASAVHLLCLINDSSGGAGCNSVGSGSPEGVVTANPGCTYLDTDADAFWVKKTGVGNIGWLPLIT